MTRHKCTDCGIESPPEKGDYTLISAPFGWRLSRVLTPDGALCLAWRCPDCWQRHKAGNASHSSPLAKAEEVPPAAAPPILLLDTRDVRREALANAMARLHLPVESMGWPEFRRLAATPHACVVRGDDPLCRVFVNAARAHLPTTWIVGLGRADGCDALLPPNAGAEEIVRAVPLGPRNGLPEGRRA